MYDHILGEVTAVHPAQVVLRCAGVGFDLKVPMGVSSALREGATACLYTILHVTDGNPTLLGFADRSEREFARLLMGVSGVGPAMSLAILSSYPVGEIAGALVDGDHAKLQSVKGVGKKTAERLCLELRDKVGALAVRAETATSGGDVLVPQTCEDAIAALITLGYTEKEARKKVGGLQERQPDATTEELIRAVLRG